MSLISKNHLSLTLQSIKKLLSGKADKSEVEAVQLSMDSKADKSEIESVQLSINSKVDRSEVETSLNLKADKNEIVQANWNQNDENALDYVKNRTHYEFDGEVVFFDEQTFISKANTSNNNEVIIDTSANWFKDASIGDLYNVYFNGVLYTCSIKNHYAMGKIIGNPTVYKAFTHDNNTGEPFVICSPSSGDMTMYTSEPIEFTLKITRNGKAIHFLDEKYIPDSIARTVDVEDYVVGLVGDTSVSEQITTAVSQKSQVQIITWEDDD